MKIALVYTLAPFTRGGAEIHVEDLCEELIERGHDVDIFRLPCSFESCLSIVNSIIAVKSLRFNEYDKVIALKFPAFYVSSPNKVFWILHQFRQVYEFWGTEYGVLETNENKGLKELVTRHDCEAFKSSLYVFTNGDETSSRLKRFNNISSVPLYPPHRNTSIFYNDSVGDFLYYPSRINDWKRQHLAVEAMKHTKSGVKLIITGVAESGSYLSEINQFIIDNKLQSKVKVINSWITEKDKCEYYAKSLGCVYTTMLEDYGYITAEAFYSHKAVITCTDSGGPTYFVKDGVNGFIAEPKPESIALAMDKLYKDKKNAERMGENGYKFIIEKNITWEETVKRLLA